MHYIIHNAIPTTWVKVAKGKERQAQRGNLARKDEMKVLVISGRAPFSYETFQTALLSN